MSKKQTAEVTRIKTYFGEQSPDVLDPTSAFGPNELPEDYVVDLYEDGRLSRDQYLDILEMKFTRTARKTLSLERVQELADAGRIGVEEVSPNLYHNLLYYQIIRPDEYLDALEEAYQSNPSELEKDRIHDLYDCERITAAEYAAHDSTLVTDVEAVPERVDLEEAVPIFDSEWHEE